MTLWMWTLTKKRKHNSRQFLGVILGICLLILCGCSKEEEVIVEPTITPSSTEETQIEEEIDCSYLYDVKAIVKEETTLYLHNENDELMEVGKLYPNTFIDLAHESIQDKIQLKESSYYVSIHDIEDSKRWFINRNHLLGLAQTIQTKDNYLIEDVRKNPVMEINQSDSYELYVLPNENDPRVGILFQNQILYIPIEYIKDGSNLINQTIDSNLQIPVLMYHFFYDESKGEVRQDTNFVEVKEFDEQLQTLQKKDYQTLTMRELLYFMEKRAQVPEHSVVITIDDGDPSVHTYAYPIIKKHEMNATVFLICGWEEQTLSWNNWEMREDGIELQSHSFDMHQWGCSGMGHGGLLQCVEYETGVQDTRMAFDYCDGGFVYCYPFGDVNDHAKQIIKDGGALLAFTTEFGKVSQDLDVLALPRVRVIGGNGLEIFVKSIEE